MSLQSGTNFYTLMGGQTANHYSAQTDENGYVMIGKFDTAATPDTTANIFQKGCQMAKTDAANNIKAIYENVGTLAVPSWNLMGSITAGEITLAQGSVLVGNASGVAVALAAGTNTQILVGNGTTLTSVAMSGDATMTNAGAVTVSASSSTDFTVTGGVISSGGTQVAGMIPTVAASSALSGAGAIPLTSYQTRFTSTATGNALTLANGTKKGQLKKVSYIAEAAGPDTGVITPVAGQGFTTATLNAIGDYIVFMWNGTAWLPIDYVGVTVV